MVMVATLPRTLEENPAPTWFRDPDFTDMAALFAATCREYASRSAYRVGGEWITYADCAVRVHAVSASLWDVLSDHRDKSGKQAVIAVLLPNSHIVLECFFAAALTHSVVFPINHRLAGPEIETALRTSGAVLLLTSNAFASHLSEIDWKNTAISTIVWATDPLDLPIRDQRSWNLLLSAPVVRDVALGPEPTTYLQGFGTSGTTGKTKTVLHTHQNVRIHSLATIEALGLSAAESHCWAHVGPMFHVGDAVFVWIATLLGARHVFHENQFQIAEVAQLLAAERVTIVKLVPSMLQLMCASESILNLDFSSLLWILTGGAAPTSALIRNTADRFGCDFIQGYGMTEATCHIAFKVETRSPATDGLRVLPELQLRIVNAFHETVEAGNVGEIAIKGEAVFGGYLFDGAFETSETAAGFTSDGFFLTGDLGYLDQSGQVHIVGRSKDMINVGGENVFAWEVERAIRQMANVKDCAAFPIPHEMLGEVVGVAVITDHGEVTENGVKAHCRGVLANFKIPHRVYLFDELPRTTTGKVQKHLIAERIREPAAIIDSGQSPAPELLPSVLDTAALEQVVLDYMKMITSSKLNADQSLFDAGLDSLGAIGLIDLLETRFRVSVPPTLLYDHPTLEALKRYFDSNAIAVIGDSIVEARRQADQDPGQSEVAQKPGGAVTPLAVVLQVLGLFVRPVLLSFSVLPVLVLLDLCSHWLNRYELLLTGPLWLALGLANAMATILVIKLVIEDSKMKSCELWSSAYFRWLFLHNLFRSLEIPLGVLRGTLLLNAFYRLCGAKIGRGVRLDSVTLHDLEFITIYDHAIIGRDVNIQPSHIHQGRLIRQPVFIGRRCVIGANASVLGGAQVPDGTHLRPLGVAGRSLSGSVAASEADISDPQQDAFLVGGVIRQILRYLAAGYLTSAAITVGILFVRAMVEGFGAAIPSISDVALGLSNTAAVPLSFFVAVPLALYLVIPVCYFGLVAAYKRLCQAILGSIQKTGGRASWSRGLYQTLIDVPFFKMYLRLSVGSHLTKWNFQLLGSCIGSRPFLVAPYTAEPELMDIADFAVLAGNVSLYAADPVTGQADKIRLGNSAIVANSCVLLGGAELGDFSLLGDLSIAGPMDVIPPHAIAVGVPPRLVGRTHFRADDVNEWGYLRNQFLLILLQVLLLTVANVAGFSAMGAVASSLILFTPFWVLWCAAPGLLLVPRLVKLLLVPVFKWAIVGRVRPGEHSMYGWYFTRWQLVETYLWDAEDAVLSQLHGTPVLNLLWRMLGARIGGNACLFSSSLACEFDLKDIGDGVVAHHQSLVFSHSIEHHSLVLRPTTVQAHAELGSFAIIEAGGVVSAGRVVAPHTAVHAARAQRPASTAPEAEGRSAKPPAAPASSIDIKRRFQALQEFIGAARENLDQDRWDYLIGASETETTYARNRVALDSLGLRPRVLRDVSTIDCCTTLLGKRLRIPVLCAPIGALEGFEPGGAASVARAVDAFGTGIIVSSVSQPGLEQTAAAAGKALKIFQLYVRGDTAWIDDHISRAIANGYDALCLTVDTDLYSRRERDIVRRHERRRVRVASEGYQASFNWRDVARIKSNFKIPLILKGIATAEDAEIAVDHGVDSIYVSNHGGRQLDHGLGSMTVLPEVVEVVADRAVIIVDGAITRGTDVIKAIALGADAVSVGRLYVYGLAAAGTPGVIRLFEILEDEIRIGLGLLGVTSFAELNKSYVREAPPVTRACLFSAFPHLKLPMDGLPRPSARADGVIE
jgi:non-ribosomal peptide synthetase-like protein